MWLFGAGGGGAGAGAAGAGAADAAAAAAGAGGSAGLLSTLGNAALTAGSWVGNTAAPWLGQQALNTPVGQLGQLAYQGGDALANLVQGNYGVGTNLPQGVTGAGPASAFQSAMNGMPSEASLMFGGRPTPASFGGPVATSGIAASRPEQSNTVAPLTTRSDLVQGILQGFDLESPIQDMAGQGTQVRTSVAPLGMPGQLSAPPGGGPGHRIGVGVNGMLTWMPSIPQAPQVPGLPGALPPLQAYRGGM